MYVYLVLTTTRGIYLIGYTHVPGGNMIPAPPTATSPFFRDGSWGFSPDVAFYLVVGPRRIGGYRVGFDV